MLETQQQLGDGVVRTVAMGTTEGLKRGLDVSNTKAPISVPVGEGIPCPGPAALQQRQTDWRPGLL